MNTLAVVPHIAAAVMVSFVAAILAILTGEAVTIWNKEWNT